MHTTPPTHFNHYRQHFIMNTMQAILKIAACVNPELPQGKFYCFCIQTALALITAAYYAEGEKRRMTACWCKPYVLGNFMRIQNLIGRV